MTYFEFTKRFPTENSAIDFIVAANTKMVMFALNVVVSIKAYTIKTMIEESYIATIANRNFPH